MAVDVTEEAEVTAKGRQWRRRRRAAATRLAHTDRLQRSVSHTQLQRGRRGQPAQVKGERGTRR